MSGRVDVNYATILMLLCGVGPFLLLWAMLPVIITSCDPDPCTHAAVTDCEDAYFACSLDNTLPEDYDCRADYCTCLWDTGCDDTCEYRRACE